jgi:hypothetical protein
MLVGDSSSCNQDLISFSLNTPFFVCSNRQRKKTEWLKSLEGETNSRWWWGGGYKGIHMEWVPMHYIHSLLVVSPRLLCGMRNHSKGICVCLFSSEDYVSKTRFQDVMCSLSLSVYLSLSSSSSSFFFFAKTIKTSLKERVPQVNSRITVYLKGLTLHPWTAGDKKRGNLAVDCGH